MSQPINRAEDRETHANGTLPAEGLSPTVRALGVVSLFTDISSEMVYPITPLYLTRALGAPTWTVGLIEGIAESTAGLLKLYSGWLSDRMGRRKPFAVGGYGMAAVAKPIMALAQQWPHVLGARFLDRAGKGLRAAPRDALITENCAPHQRGRAFGFHRSLDTVGAVLGPLIGWWYLQHHPGAFRGLYRLAFLPAVIGLLILIFFVHERRAKSHEQPLKRKSEPNDGKETKPTSLPLSSGYRRYLWIVGVFSIGNSSDAFLLLRAGDMGVPVERLLLLYALFNVVEA